MLKLILPEEKYWLSFQDGVEEMKKFPTPYDTNAIKSGLKCDNFFDYKIDCENSRLGIGLKDGYVASTRLWLIEDEKFVGIFDIRHGVPFFCTMQSNMIFMVAILQKFPEKCLKRLI